MNLEEQNKKRDAFWEKYWRSRQESIAALQELNSFMPFPSFFLNSIISKQFSICKIYGKKCSEIAFFLCYTTNQKRIRNDQ